MRPGMQTLLEILRGRAGCRAVDTAEWDAALILAHQEHVLPFVAARILQSGIELPDAIRQRVVQAQREATLAAFFWTSELRILLREFAAAKIDVIPLKGPSLAERLYGGTALRISRDLDVLVRKSDYVASESLLASLDFIPTGRPDDYHRQWRRETATIELHFDVENPLAIDFHVAGAWERSRPGVFSGQPCRILAPDYELLYLCIHGVRHRFERLSLVLDIALALETFAGSQLNLRKETAGLTRLVMLGIAMASHLNPECAGKLDNVHASPASQRMQRLADNLWHELMEAPQPELDWQSQHAFFLETELTPSSRFLRRVAHMRIAATRLIDPDFAFAARFGLRRPWQVWLLRPARLLFARSRPHTR